MVGISLFISIFINQGYNKVTAKYCTLIYIYIYIFPVIKENRTTEIIAVNEHIIMISEGSCETKDWSNDVEHSALPSEE